MDVGARTAKEVTRVSHGMAQDGTQTLLRQRTSAAGAGDCRVPVRADGPSPAPSLRRHGGLVPDRREHPRHGRVHRPADLPAGRRAPDGALHHDGRVPPLVRGADHGRHPLLRLRPAGPQGQAARPDLGQAGGEPDRRRRRRPGADDGPAQGADPGVLRHPDRPPLRRARDHRLPVAAAVRQGHHRVAGRRRRRARPRLRQAAGRGPGDHRQAAQLGDGLGRGDERHRRHQGPHLRPAGRHHRHRRHHREGGPGAGRPGRRADHRLRRPRRAVAAGHRPHQQPRRSSG